ncbi:hypothetical protein [Sinorhizobium meliloti]|uniref:hypothetical protein n=1 Tax=Rhizobium meliloti TaxID=382 RepID=UPI00299F1922|nr:hypothetical protein [Sinorhizobium meliloti]
MQIPNVIIYYRVDTKDPHLAAVSLAYQRCEAAAALRDFKHVLAGEFIEEDASNSLHVAWRQAMKLADEAQLLTVCCSSRFRCVRLRQTVRCTGGGPMEMYYLELGTSSHSASRARCTAGDLWAVAILVEAAGIGRRALAHLPQQRCTARYP